MAIIISQYPLTFKWAFTCVWTGSPSQVGNRLLFQWLAYCFPVISHMTGNILLGKFSPKHFTLSPEQEKKWLDWDEQLARTISLEVTPPLAIKADDTKKQTQKFCLSGDCSSPISYDE